MAFWTIVCKELPEPTAGTPKSFSVMLDTDKKTWSGFGSNLATFMSARSGNFTFHLSGENGLKLADAGGKWMATFAGLIASTAVGATGKGKAERSQFSWRFDSN